MDTWMFFLFIFYSTQIIEEVKGLTCLECQDSFSLASCRRKGKVVQCQDNELTCLTEIRRPRVARPGGTSSFRIRKLCKQARACDNNYWQNVGGFPGNRTNGHQCAGENGDHQASTVCRCCCTGDLCNTGVFDACTGGTNIARQSVSDRILSGRQSSRPVEPTCSSIDGFPRNGNFRCSRINLPSSFCTFSCNAPYTLHGRRQLSCQHTAPQTAEWTHTIPCCRRDCPPYAGVDLVVAYQSTVGGEQEWHLMRSFVVSLLRPFLSISTKDTQIGVYSFHAKPDFRREIIMNRKYNNEGRIYRRIFDTRQTKEPANWYAAIEHAQRRSLSASSGNREGYRDILVFVFHNMPGDYGEDETIPARQLRDFGAKIMVIGVMGKEIDFDIEAFRERLTAVAGDENNVFMVADVFQLSSIILPSQSQICGEPCQRYRENNDIK